MTKRTIIFSLVFIIGIVSTISCDRKTYNTVSSIVTKNSKASEKKPYLILISLDGFRWDYVEKYKPPHLINFIKNGINSIIKHLKKGQLSTRILELERSHETASSPITA